MLQQVMDFLAIWTLIALIVAPLVGAFLGLGDRSADRVETADETIDTAA